ncbi:MAG: glycosyltransferase family 2 protein [Candidatus Omnitrophica bacterium]|nr:glycosyltransferase family 2 protein [Candidatus Omnitrophota bacterium]
MIPAYQAEKTIGPLVSGLAGQGFPVTVVDDGSSDRTAERAEEAGARVIRRRANGGKGAALRDGFSVAREGGYAWVLTLDADGQHLPREAARFLKAREEGAEVILGNRMGDPGGMPLDRRLANRWMSWVISRMAGQPIPDTQCGFRLFSRRVLDSIELTSQRFEIDSEMVLRMGWAGIPLRSVPVSSVYRRELSFIRPLRDTFRFFLFLWRMRRQRRARTR